MEMHWMNLIKFHLIKLKISLDCNNKTNAECDNENQSNIILEKEISNHGMDELGESSEDNLLADIHENNFIFRSSTNITEKECSVCFLSTYNVPAWLNIKNISVAEYCIELLTTREKFKHKLNKSANKIFIDRSLDCKQKLLGNILSSFDSFLRLNKNWSWMAKTRSMTSLGLDPITFYVEKLILITQPKDKESFIKDSEKFLQIYKSRSDETDALNHKDYWGSPQQIMSGKVIADFVAEDYGPLDPVFGILLNPTTGRVGPGDASFIHNMLFDKDGPWAYHAAVHDAFGYLKTFHNVGPGYNYLGGVSAIDTCNCMAGQTSGLLFWNQVVNKLHEN